MKINIKPFLLFGFLLGAALATGRDLFYQLSYLMGALLFLTFAWVWISVRWVDIERIERAHRTQVGRVHEERIVLRNRGRLPKLWLEVRDHSDLPNHLAGRVVDFLPGGAERSWLVRTVCQQRGRFTLGPITLRSADPFGIFENERPVDIVEHLVVWPQTVDLPSFSPPIGRLTGGEALQRRTHHVTANVSGVRDYYPGDSFNRIHWRSTARHNRLIVKEFELDPSADIWIFLDMEQTAHVGKPAPAAGEEETEFLPLWVSRTDAFRIEPTTEEYSIVVAASIAKHFLARRKSVGLITYGQRREVVMADRGERQLNKILEELAVVRAVGRIPLAQVLATEGQTFGRNVTVVVITPSIFTDWLSIMRDMARRSLQPVAALLDARSFGGTQSSEKVQAGLISANVPIYTVKKDEDLAVAFSQALEPGGRYRAA
ncbi:MAG: DUF58 domain-containing protein [Chloroflexi bacterium]|nr:DUF58 domain-containing protein [Chloroflexota bacterium]